MSKQKTTASEQFPQQIELRHGTAELELFMAQRELSKDEGDLAHGAQHLAALLLLDPFNVEWIELAYRYYEKAGNSPESRLLPEDPEGNRYATTEALRAWVWQQQGKLDDAVARLLVVIDATSTSYYLDAWLLEWLEPEGQAEQLTSEITPKLMDTLMKQVPEFKGASARKLKFMRRWAKVIMRLTPSAALKQAWEMLSIGYMRRCGLFEEALAKTGSIEQANDWHTLMTIALIHSQQNRPDLTEQACAKAITLDPNEVSAYLDAAEAWFNAAEWESAKKWFEMSLNKVDAKHWAQSSIWFCNWKLTNEDQWMQKIIEAAEKKDENARRLYYKAFAKLPYPEDASANVLNKLVDEYEATKAVGGTIKNQQGTLKLSASSLEAPSNLLAFDLEFKRFGLTSKVEMSYDSIPSPDPRIPFKPINYLLWHYEGSIAKPALPKPSTEVQQAIAELAQKKFAPHANWAQASHLALKYGPLNIEGNKQQEDRSLELLACMVYPPQAPKKTPVLEWLPRVQLSCAQVIAQMELGWQGSRRRELLLSVLFGPTDWATKAAIMALSWIAKNEPAHALDIHQRFAELEQFAPDDGYCCWLKTLYRYWQEIPFLVEDEMKALQEKLNALELDEDKLT